MGNSTGKENTAFCPTYPLAPTLQQLINNGLVSGDMVIDEFTSLQLVNGECAMTSASNSADENEVNELKSGDQLFGLSGAIGESIVYIVDVAPETIMLTIDITGGSGDADLYVAQGRVPTTKDYDFAPFLDGNDERVEINAPTPGIWYILIHGFDQFQDVSLSVFTL